MTQEEINHLSERLRWLEQKMVRVLWFLISGSSAFTGWVVANIIVPEQTYGWLWALVFGVTWVAAGVVLQRIEFRGAPRHIQFIDP